MSWLDDLPLQRKLTLVILAICTVVMLLACASLAIYEVLDFRRAMVRDTAVLADILGRNTQAALAFGDGDQARTTLQALQAEPHVLGARLYQRDAAFADYLRPGAAADFPEHPGDDGARFADGRLVLVRAIVLDDKRIGTILLAVDLQGMYDRLAVFAGLALLVVLGCVLLALALSSRLQRLVSGPILALAGIAKVVAERKDYTVRAPPQGRNELGALTEAFNHMLGQIHGQNLALIESAARVRAVLDTALSAVVVIDAQGRVTDWNAKAETMFGRTGAEVRGEELAELIIPTRYREAHRHGLRHYLAHGEGAVVNRLIEMSALRRDGSEFPVELSVSPMRTGDTVTFCGFVTDITERKRMEEIRVRLAAIVESSDDAIISKTLDGIITSWNPGAAKLFGFTAAEAIGKPMAMLIPSERAAEEPDILARVSRGESVDHFETVRVGKDGRRLDISATISPIRNVGGTVVGASKIARDITDRKLAEAKLQAQVARLNLLNRITRAIGERQDLPSIFQVVIRTLEDDLPIDFGCICLYDPLAQVLNVTSVGAHSEALAMELALPVKAAIPIDQNGLGRCVAGRLVYEPDISGSQFAFPQRLFKGGLRALVVAPLLVESQVFGVLIAARRQPGSFSSAECEFLRQLSEQVALAAHQSQLYGALQQAYDDLRQTQQSVMQQERLRALGQMASGIAHDINNAISPVALYTESLLEREQGLSTRARGYLETIKRAIEDVAHTVARMREFYRQREPQFQLAPVDLNQMVQQVIDLTRARWSDMPQQRGIVIRVDTDAAPGLPAIMGIASEVREALINLVFNGVDAMPEGGTLTLRTRVAEPEAGAEGMRATRHAVIEVVDTGVGMDDETRRRCLEPFFTTKGERGTGLGLAMVYGVAQRHSAEIEIDSAPQAGSTMRLRFPVPAVPGPAEAAAVTYTVPSRLRLLLVDDDPLLLKSLRDTLEDDGHQIVIANRGQDGIDTFQEALAKGESFAAVITDLGMPYVDGRKVSAAIKGMSPTTPVIMLTGWGQRLIAEGDVPPHVDCVLNKPPKLNDLRATLARLCPPGPR